MKKLIFKKQTPYGEVKVILIIKDNLLYFKYNNKNDSKALIDAYRNKGIGIKESNNWIEINLFNKESFVKIKNYEIDLENDDLIEIENKLTNIYTTEYIKNGFQLE